MLFKYTIDLVREELKKMWIYPHFGGWVVQDGDKIHKKTCL